MSPTIEIITFIVTIIPDKGWLLHAIFVGQYLF